ncbi:sigma-70 family RNA polymerase sigma factor [Candidatus Daviesbacteria bacterium]|nr:sigma-70 family RNA polymerase sigma factor [Candidatus Daviesbacteria bacterium]
MIKRERESDFSLDLVGVYLTEAGTARLLKAEEERQLAQGIEAGKLVSAVRARLPWSERKSRAVLKEGIREVLSGDVWEALNQHLGYPSPLVLEQNLEPPQYNETLESLSKIQIGNQVDTSPREISTALRILREDDGSGAYFDTLEDIGKKARSSFIEANLRLAIDLSKHWQGRGLDLEDLFQEGNIGLIRAVDRFDYRRGYKFSTYASWWIRQAVSRAVYDKGRYVRLPVHLNEVIVKLRHIAEDLVEEYGRDPTNKEMAQKANLPIEQVARVSIWTQQLISLETQINSESEDVLGDFMEDKNAEDPQEAAVNNDRDEAIKKVMADLTDRERRVLWLRYGFNGRDYTLEEVSREFGVSRERIRQIEVKALRKLKLPSRAEKLALYW